jgi:uncharacterized membrane protein YqhA
MLRIALASRYVMLLTAIGAVVAAAVMCCEAATKLVDAVHVLLAGSGSGAAAVTTPVMRATDALLFALVLLIFAYAITFGFVLDLSRDDQERLPAWMRVAGVHELKHTLVEVILVYLVVDFATDVGEAGAHLSWESLILPISVFLIAGALRILPSHQANKAGVHGGAVDQSHS